MSQKLWSIVLLCSATMGFAKANTVITFDDLPGMANIPGSFVPAQNQLSNQLLDSHKVVFNSGAGYVAVVNHVVPTPSLPNVIGGTNSSGQLSYASNVQIRFMMTASVQGMVDYFKVRGDQTPASGNAYLRAYDVSGNLLGSVTQPDSTAGLTLELSIPGIHRVELTQDSGTIGFDNVEYSTVLPVPEPTSMAAVVIGCATWIRMRKGRRS
ncbi:MAG: PEP-CTERM sorting domain-containing protein [Chthonomonas sp.]|nr:PEP-CTERM sorting domain-containing protein [Chthonomonas sp.]